MTYNEENYNLVGYGIKDKTYVEKEEGDLKWREVPAGESANSINELFSSVYVGYNAKFNTDWVQSTTPRSVVSAYKLAVSWPTE